LRRPACAALGQRIDLNDRVLKGAKLVDLLVQQSTKVELVSNLKDRTLTSDHQVNRNDRN
jgi:hypothetical protein